MVQVGIMRVPVDQRRVTVPMAVRLARRVVGRVVVPVMLVMGMAVRMLGRIMDMVVLVPLGEVQIEAERHQRRGGQ